jgi:hypothetical protein
MQQYYMPCITWTDTAIALTLQELSAVAQRLMVSECEQSAILSALAVKSSNNNEQRQTQCMMRHAPHIGGASDEKTAKTFSSRV